MRVSAIIPVLNEASLVCDAVALTWRAGADEVIVADGGSTDGTIEAAQRSDCIVVETTAGRGWQQNAGARRAGGDVLLFLHADNWLDARAIDQVRDSLRSNAVECGAFRQQIDATGLVYRLLERGNAARVRWRGLPYGDQGIFMRKQAFWDLGGFPEVRLMEDVLLMKRSRRRSWPLLLPGPLHVSPRRWQRYGVLRQTLRNWWLLSALHLGASPDRLAAHYASHDVSSIKDTAHRGSNTPSV